MAVEKGKQTQFDLVIGGVNRFSNMFKGFNDRVDKTTAKMREMQGALGNLNKATGFSRLTGAFSGVTGSMKNVVSEGKKLVSTVAGLVGKMGILFGATGGGLLALAKSTANAGSAVADSAKRAGVGVTLWQEYAHAAEQSGVSLEQLEKSFIKLQDISVKAARGDKSQAGLLKSLGIDPKTVNGEVKTADTLFLELADKLKAFEDIGQGAKAPQALKSLLGDEGVKLLPMLGEGRDALIALRQEAHEFDMFSKEDTQRASEFNNSLAKTQKALMGIGVTVGRKITPELTKLFDKLTELANKYRETIGKAFEGWISKINFDEVWKSIESGFATLSRLAQAVNSIAQAFGGWDTILIAVAVVISGKFVWSIGLAVNAFGKLALAFLSTPFGLFLAGVAAVAVAVYKIYQNWDDLVSYFSGLWQGVKSAFERNWLEGVLTFLWNFNPVRLVAKGMNELVAYFTGFDLFSVGGKWIDSLQSGFSAKWGEVTGWFKEKIESLTGWMPDWVKDKLGFSASVTPPSFGEPLNAETTAKGLSESRSEHVERQENTVTLVPPEGWGMQVGGPSSGVRQSGTSMQIGYEAYGY